VEAALVAGFAATLGVRFAPLGLAPEEASLARRLEMALAPGPGDPEGTAETLAFSIP